MKRVSVVLIALIAAAAMIVATRAQVGDPPPAAGGEDAVVAEYMAAARSACDVKDYDTGLALYQEVLTGYPDRAEAGRAAVNIGYILRNVGRTDDAEAAFEYAVAAYPATEYAAEAQTRLGYIALAQGDRERARREFVEAVTAYPGTVHAAEAQMRLGYLVVAEMREAPDPAAEMALRQEAAEAFAAAIEGSWDRPDIASEAYAQYAGLYFEWGLAGQFTFEEVREVCRKVLEYFPAGETESLATAQLMIAESYLFDDRPADAYTEALRVVDLYPEARTQTAFAYWVAGQGLEGMKALTEAIDAYLAVMEGGYTAEDNFAGRNIQEMCAFRIAECLRRTNRCQEAHPWYRYVIRNWPRTPMARTARRALWLMPPQM